MVNQPKPVDGQQDVKPLLVVEFCNAADERYRFGLEKYGKPLQTFNGRDAGRDAFEEWYDLGIYLKQLRLEVDLKNKYIEYVTYAIEQQLRPYTFDAWMKNNGLPNATVR